MGPGGTPETDERGPGFSGRVLRALPGLTFVIDEIGTVRFATEEAAAFIGRRADEVIGTSVLTYVDAPTAWAYASAVAMATDYPTVTTGPLRVSLIGADGEPRLADLWAANRLDDPEIAGIVCLLTEATVAFGLSEAIESVAAGDPLISVVDKVVRSLTANPVVAEAAFVVPNGDGFASFTPSELPAEVIADRTWARETMTTGVRVLHPDLARLDTDVARAAHAAGLEALWVEPVLTSDRPCPGALVLGRRRPGNPSPNQLNSVHQAAAILAVAVRLDADRAIDASS